MPYTRASSAAKTVEDTTTWRCGRGATSSSAWPATPRWSPGCSPSAATRRTWDDPTKRIIDRIHEDAAAVALAHKRADIGTAVHRLTERLDRGEQRHRRTVRGRPRGLRQRADRGRPRPSIPHRVPDGLRHAGDGRHRRPHRARAEDRHRILDLKTGASVQYGALGWAAQLAAYAHGQLYDVEHGERLDTPAARPHRSATSATCRPAKGVCRLYEIDLVAGHRAAVLANEIRAVRQESRRWISPLAAHVMDRRRRWRPGKE